MKNRFLSKRYCKDIATPMGKAMDLTHSFDDLINLCLGDPDLITDERIIDSAFADAKRRYTNIRTSEAIPNCAQRLQSSMTKNME